MRNRDLPSAMNSSDMPTTGGEAVPVTERTTFDVDGSGRPTNPRVVRKTPPVAVPRIAQPHSFTGVTPDVGSLTDGTDLESRLQNIVRAVEGNAFLVQTYFDDFDAYRDRETAERKAGDERLAAALGKGDTPAVIATNLGRLRSDFDAHTHDTNPDMIDVRSGTAYVWKKIPEIGWAVLAIAAPVIYAAVETLRQDMSQAELLAWGTALLAALARPVGSAVLAAITKRSP